MNTHFIKEIDEKIPQEYFSNLKTKILIQNPGKGLWPKYVFYKFYDGLGKKFPFKNYHRKVRHILKNCLFIVEEDPIDFMYVFCSVTSKVSLSERTPFHHISKHSPITFNYWNLPEKTFDVIISINPVRLELLKDDGILVL